ncbi:3-demethoxyubiquinol 3-hydroxylase [Larsenimonas salina]|uniref:3-demethoxyubiquinol 3-hydroxylase n=1 Tax=Larsenimonas salina TaxID=1295565 RepID=UPI002072B6FA|nr:demethoxyubiquinone hydroxylase family protein [Larsenimonas salina]MCM5703915.1 demethoxyubiquinone hydroxylase family protein [Larsenimonas salina]
MALNRADRMISQFDTLLRVLVPSANEPQRASPAHTTSDGALSAEVRKRSARSVKGQYTHALCVQAIYQGQMLASRSPKAQARSLQVAGEQWDQLGWCQQRIRECGGRSASVFDPPLYVGAMASSAVLARINESAGLSFVHTVTQASHKHLERSIRHLPEDDRRSKAVFQAMQGDNAHHARQMLEAGGKSWPMPCRWALTMAARGVSLVGRHG